MCRPRPDRVSHTALEGERSVRDPVVILGASGMLGHQVVRRLAARRRVIAVARRFPDPRLRSTPLKENVVAVPAVVSAATVAGLLRAHGARYVINAAGIIKQRPEAVDAVTMIRINSLLPHELAAVCREAGASLLHISTDCVFDGSRGFYAEDDPLDAQDLYGRTKALGEVTGPGCLTLRTSMIGPELASRYGLLEWFRSCRGGSVQGYRRVMFSGLPTVRVARLIEDLLDRCPTLSGVYHVAADPVSKLDLLRLINDRYHLHVTITPTDEPVVDRSLNGRRFRDVTGFRPEPWEALVDEMARGEDLVHAS